MGQCLSSVTGSSQELVDLLRVLLQREYVTDDDLRRLAEVCTRIGETRQATLYETLLLLRVMRHADLTRGEDTYDEYFDKTFRASHTERTRFLEQKSD